MDLTIPNTLAYLYAEAVSKHVNKMLTVYGMIQYDVFPGLASLRVSIPSEPEIIRKYFELHKCIYCNSSFRDTMFCPFRALVGA